MKKTKEDKSSSGRVQLSKKIIDFYSKYTNKSGNIKT